MDPTTRPVPVPDEVSAPFWEAAAAGSLVLARCSQCEGVSHPPGPVCPRCGSTEPAYRFEPVTPAGTVRSWTILRQPFLPGFADDLPIVLVDVEVDGTDGVRLIGRLIDGPDVPLTLGARVEVAFESIAYGVTIPAFALAR